MNAQARWWEIAVFLIGATALASYMIYSSLDPAPNIECRFQAEPGQTAVRLGTHRGPIRSIVLSGYIDDPFEGEMYDFEGRASFQVDGLKKEAPVDGRVFLDGEEAVLGLTLTIQDRAFGPDGLDIVTLRADGMLDYDRTRAFVYTDRAFKMSHPVRYSCKTSLAKT